MAPYTVTGLMAVRNGLPYVGEALDAMLNQTVPLHEIVVVDDGSGDGTADFIRDRYPGVKLVRSPRSLGMSAAYNLAAAQATGGYLALCDADDLWLPWAAETHLAAAATDPEAEIILAPGAIRADSEVNRTYHALCSRPPGAAERPTGLPLEALLASPGCSTSGLFIKREAFVAAGGFDPALSRATDLDLWLRVAARRGRALGLGRPLFVYRILPGSLSSDRRLVGVEQLRVVSRWDPRRDPQRSIPLDAYRRRCTKMVLWNLYRLAVTRQRPPAAFDEESGRLPLEGPGRSVVGFGVWVARRLPGLFAIAARSYSRLGAVRRLAGRAREGA